MKIRFALAALFTWVAMFSAPMAYADDYLNAAVQSLQSATTTLQSSSCLLPPAPIPADLPDS